jgi:hypothetical protein
MPRKAPNELKFDRVLAEYRQKYNVDSLDSPNDIANLHTMIRNQIIIEKLQLQMNDLTDQDTIDPVAVKKILDSLVALSESNVVYERTLGIDRKSRKQESAESTADYIAGLKARAKEWLDNEERLTKVHCKPCGIMVGRISGVYETTAYEGSFQCPQCKKNIIIKRQERDVFYDVKDANWRRKYPIEIEQAKRTSAPTFDDIEDEMTIGEE